MRFGARLSYELDLPAELAEVEIPPMLIQPLVENAVTHGIEPCMMGGRIVLSARAAGDGAVQVSIADTGVGFAHGGGKGSGLGLTHVRERLARIFGAGASMQIEENSPRGVIVRLTLPIGQGARDSGQRAASGAGEAGPALAGRPATASLGAAARS